MPHLALAGIEARTMGLLGRGMLVAARLRGAQLERRTLDPRRVQERTLRRLVQRAKATAFGRDHDFERITDVGSFRERVPLGSYAERQRYFLRALEGEPDVSWPGRIRYFGWSSGTTAGNKYLPVSMDSVRQQQRGGFDLVAVYLRETRDVGLFDGRCLMLGGSSSLEQRPSGVWVGDNTGIMTHHVPRFMQRTYRPSEPIRRLRDWDAKIEATARECANEDVRMLAGTPSWFAGLFDHVLAEARRRGRRADTLSDVWPNLRLMTGGGVGFEPYRPLIEARLGRRVPYLDGYSATEGGVMGIQDRLHEQGMLVVPDGGVFYEFVPVEDLGSPTPRRLPLWEVDVGGVYALAVSTCSGIFAYLIGDVLRFVSVFPHRFSFEGRTAAYLSVTGEHVSSGEIERAVRHACAETSSEVVDFTVTCDVGVAADGSPGSAARHVWWVEFGARRPELLEFARRIDEAILRGNDDYAVHRRSAMGLLPPVVRAVPRGAFHDWMRSRGKLGGQNKVPRVLSEPSLVTSWRAFAERARPRDSDGHPPAT